MPLSDYYSRVNPDLLALVPPDARCILEIGCGAGALCEAYRRVNPGVEWYGVELNNDAAKLAREPGRLDTVSRFDWDHVLRGSLKGDPDWTNDRYDCLILGDILEHLADPWDGLAKAVPHLKPGAQVIACIPNVQHWTVILGLLAGHWTYTDEGLMDRTHLRFFTLESIREMFKGVGLQVHEIRGRDIGNEGFDEWIKGSGITPAKEMRAYQFLVRAVKPPADIKPLHIHAVTNEQCCARPRIHEPFAMLATIPGVKCTTWPPTPIETHRPQIWIQQRNREFDIEINRRLIELGSLLVAEVDDLPEAIGMDPMALKAVHAVQCSTERLAEVCREFNPHVMVFENQIAELGPIKERQGMGGRICIFYGAQNRKSDWEPIMPSINRVIAEYGDRIAFSVVHDQAFYDALEAGEHDKEFYSFCEYNEYRRLIQRCDIALLPLEPTPFNECKSSIKFLEAAAENVAVLASKTVYESSILSGSYETRRGWIYEAADEFEDLLRIVIEQSDMRAQRAALSYEYVRDNRLLSQHFRHRYDWYLDLIARRDRLQKDLYARCPELAPASQSQPVRSGILS